MCSISHSMHFDCKAHYNDLDTIHFITECLLSAHALSHTMEDKNMPEILNKKRHWALFKKPTKYHKNSSR